MKIQYSKDYEKLIAEAQSTITKLQKEMKLEKEQYYKDNNMSCNTCRYSWLNDVETMDYHTLCEKRNCKLCRNICDEYQPINETSEFLKDNYQYDNDLRYAYENMYEDKSIADAPLDKVQKFCELYNMKED